MSHAKASDASVGSRPKCPICGAPRRAEYTPFCSKRCADVDLHRWLGGTYVVPGEPVVDEGDGRPDPSAFGKNHDED